MAEAAAAGAGAGAGTPKAGAEPASGSSSGGGNVKVFLRLKPSSRPSGFFAVAPDGKMLDFTLPVHSDGGGDIVNSSKANYKFKFDDVFDMGATQDQVFDRVAAEATQSVLDGYNATVFAYGQTGSGKTFTITGGAERYDDRGIIPRTLGKMFQHFKSRSDVQYTAYISYLEIYNEAGYDLLDPSHESKALEELPRVSMLEDEEGNVHMRNLAMHPASTEEEALNLLFLGDTNRAIAETPMNLASSRSHCIFTISLESRQEGSSAVRRSKLHLVDLAGSERVHKTHASGQLFREATHINKSLHFLEMVIVALQEQRKGIRSHIPYRNSMLTNMLRDSLGGNCKTTMIATINVEPEHTGESVSTCRFAQRVALVKNAAVVNEAVDPTILIRQLRGKLQGLEAEVKVLKSGLGEGEAVSEREAEAIMAAARSYVVGPDDGELTMGLELTLTRIKAAFACLRKLAREGSRGPPTSAAEAVSEGAAGAGKSAAEAAGAAPAVGAPAPMTAAPDPAVINGYKDEIKRLKAALTQRDNEIAILVGMVKAAKAGAPPSAAAMPSAAAAMPSAAAAKPSPSVAASFAPPPLASLPSFSIAAPAGRATSAGSPSPSPGDDGDSAGGAAAAPPAGTPHMATMGVGLMLANGVVVDEATLRDRPRAFEVFRASYPGAPAMEENKRVLKSKYDTAKATAERVNAARDETNRLKAEIERGRVERAMANIVEGKGGDDASADDAAAAATAAAEAEAELRAAMDDQKNEYRRAFQELRDLKAEIEGVQRTLEANRLKMQADFESWLANCSERLASGSGAPSAAATPRTGSGGATRAATLPPTPKSVVTTASDPGGGGGSGAAAARPPSGGTPGFSWPGAMPYGGSMMGGGAGMVAAWPGMMAGMPTMGAGMPTMVMTPQGLVMMPPGGMSGGMMPGQVALPMLHPSLAAAGMAPAAMPTAMSAPMMMAGPYAGGMMMGPPGAMASSAGWPAAAAAAPQRPPSTSSTSSATAPIAAVVGGALPSPAAPTLRPALSAGAASSGAAAAAASGSSWARPPLPSGAGAGVGPGTSAPLLTGNAAADADILAFYKAKDELLRRTRSGGGGLASVMADAARLSAGMSPSGSGGGGGSAGGGSTGSSSSSAGGGAPR